MPDPMRGPAPSAANVAGASQRGNAPAALPYQRLYVNIDHVATLRQARRSRYPDPVAAATLCEDAGADGITVHLREDRRHIQDADVYALAPAVRTPLNLECAITDEMVAIAEQVAPYQVTFVPERREEVTTEGGLDVLRHRDALARAIARLHARNVRTSLFIDADEAIVRASAGLGVHAIELHTGAYAHATDDAEAARPLAALRDASSLAASLGLAVHAGHGLTVGNVGPVAAIPEIEELNIGHAIVSQAVFIGLEAAVGEVRAAMDAARPVTNRATRDRDATDGPAS